MRKLIATFAAAAGVLALAAPLGTVAAPVMGFEAQYASLVGNCTLPSGTVLLCEAAINGYSSALVGAVDLDEAMESFIEARAEVFIANEPDETFQAEIDALFELLLPDSGAILNGFGAEQASPN